MSQNKTICETKPLFMLGLRNEIGGLTLGIPLVYDGLLADHVYILQMVPLIHLS